MDPNLFSQVASGIGMAGGLWALVRWAEERKANGNGGGSPSEPDVQKQGLYDLHVTHQNHMQELVDRVSELASKAANPVLVREPAPSLEWVTGLEERLAVRLAEAPPPTPPPPSFPPEIAQSLERISDRLEALIQMGPAAVEAQPAPQDLAPLADELEKRFDKLGQDIAAALGRPQPPKQSTEARGPAARAPNPIYLELFNTLYLNDNTIYELIPLEADIYNVNVMNLGPGRAFMGPTDQVFIQDPHATTIPPGAVDNEIHTPGRVFVIADGGGVILSVRLTYAV